MSSLNAKIKKEIVPSLQQALGIKNSMAVPKLYKIVVNAAVRNALSDTKNVERLSAVISQITGQKPKVAKAKKSIASFKLRKGDEIGLVSTLRGKRMYDFFKKLIHIVLPRLKDFHGVSRASFDGQGNYTLGFSEFTVFPEIDPGKTDFATIGQGIEVTIVTTANDNKEGVALLELLGMPFRKGDF